MSPEPPPAAGRPTPVRVGAPRTAPPADVPNPTRAWTGPGGEVWTVEVVGRARAGGRGGAGADLLLLVFRPGSSESAESTTRGPREVLTAAVSLGDVGDEELEGLLERSVPFDPQADAESRFFEGTRRGRRP